MPSTNGVGMNNLIQTSGNSTTTILEREIADATSGMGFANLVVRRLSDAATKAFTLRFTYKKETGAITVAINPLDAVGSAGDLVSLLLVTATVDVSGSNVRVRVTGLLSTNLIWYADWTGTELVDD